jgi:hypothetical protein
MRHAVQFGGRFSLAAAFLLAGCFAAAAAETYKAPAAGGPRLLEVTGVKTSVNMRAEASASAAVAAKLPLGARLSNFGCAAAGGKVWCDVQPMEGGARGFVSADFLKPAMGPDGAVAMGEDDSAMRLASGKVNATGQVPCAANKGQPMGQCDFRVARGTGGYGTIEISHAGGLKRVIFFVDGKPTGFSAAEADGSAALQFSATKDADLNRISIGNERYEIPDAAILGG